VSGPTHGTLSAIDQAAGTVTYTPQAGYSGSDSFSFRSNDGGFDSNAATADLSVDAGPAPPGPSPVPPGPAATARLTKLTLVPATFRAATKGATTAARRKRAPVGTRIAYLLDRAATTTFTVTRSLPGIRKGKRCAAPPRRHTKGHKVKRCTRIQRLGRFTRVSPAGANGLHFTGRLRGRSLPRGKYKLHATARAAGAKISDAVTKPFTIVR
jgi:hypothetical protein